MLKGPTHQGRLFLNALCAQLLGHVQLSVASWTIARQDPLSVGFFRQENWAGSPFPTPAALPNPGIKAWSLESPALAGKFFTTITSSTWEALFQVTIYPEALSS